MGNRLRFTPNGPSTKGQSFPQFSHGFCIQRTIGHLAWRTTIRAMDNRLLNFPMGFSSNGQSFTFRGERPFHQWTIVYQIVPWVFSPKGESFNLHCAQPLEQWTIVHSTFPWVFHPMETRVLFMANGLPRNGPSFTQLSHGYFMQWTIVYFAWRPAIRAMDNRWLNFPMGFPPNRPSFILHG